MIRTATSAVVRLALLLALAAVLRPAPAAAETWTNYLVVTATKVVLSDDQDDVQNGEIQYAAAVATGDRGHDPIVTQTVGFPMELWYEAEGNGVNSVYMSPARQGLPIFCFPESQMGEDLAITLHIFDDDATPAAFIVAHDLARHAGTAVATAMAGPAVGALVKVVSDEVHRQIVEGSDRDIVDRVIFGLGKADHFGMGQGGNYQNDVIGEKGKATVSFDVRRVRVSDAYKDWCVGVSLDKVKIIEDADPGLKGDGEIYIRARVAYGFTGNDNAIYEQRTKQLPSNGGTVEVDAGHSFPLQDARAKTLYVNSASGGSCTGLPPFLYVEVCVFEDDDEDSDDVIGVLPVCVNNWWMRHHPGATQLTYRVRGADSDEKAEITLTINVYRPAAPH